MAEAPVLRRVLIVADESADWVVAGLRQLDRLALSLNEFAKNNQPRELIRVTVLWNPRSDKSQHWMPKDERLSRVAFASDFEGQTFDLTLSTRLFLYRNALAQLIEQSPAHFKPDAANLWEISWERSDGRWDFIAEQIAIQEIERRFLRGSGKSQDGVVSRYLNRPISRNVTRFLLKFSITPNEWTLLIFPLPLAATFILLSGNYPAFLVGLAIFQLFSILDGCDGEIARAKFLESESGRRLDDIFDILSNILLVLGLGFGLSRHSEWNYLLEGLAAAALIGLNELLLTIRTPAAKMVESDSLGGALYPRHRELIERSGMLLLGEKFAYWLIQFTKRDVALLFFLVLAALGQPAWILHLLVIATALTLALALNRSIR